SSTVHHPFLSPPHRPPTPTLFPYTTLFRSQHFFFRISEPKRVFVLECGERLDCMCATNRLHSSFRKAEVLHLALLKQLLHRTGDVFDRHAGIDAVLIEQVDNVSPKSL